MSTWTRTSWTAPELAAHDFGPPAPGDFTQCGKVRKTGTRYAAVEMDLHRTDYDLSPTGQEIADKRLMAAYEDLVERGGLRGKASVSFHAGPTLSYISRVFRDQAQPLLDDLRAIAREHALPIDWLDNHPQKGTHMSTVLHKDGDQFAIVTEADDEVAFVAEFSDALSHLVDENAHDGDWRFQFQRWFPLAFEVTCKYRGYKSLVTERRTIISGQLDPNAALVAAGRVAEGVSPAVVEEA